MRSCGRIVLGSWGMLLLLMAGGASGGTIIPAGSATTWRYLDDGAEPDPNWRDLDFADSAWKSGASPLGYGEARISTLLRFGADPEQKPITTWFRHRFDMPTLAAREHLVLSICVDDGAIIYLNGKEVDRVNMPDGPISPETRAVRRLDSRSEGFYIRLGVPTELARPGEPNLLAVEVHQNDPTSSDVYLDVALHSAPNANRAPKIDAVVRNVVETYHKQHYIRPGTLIPDGYLDGGRQMQVNVDFQAHSSREILWVDRIHDPALTRDLTLVRAREFRSLPPAERIRRIAAQIDRQSTPPGGPNWLEPTVTQLENEYRDKPILIGEWLDQAQAGVCRHRALLFKILADEAGLATALTRGNYRDRGQTSSPHVWNEVALDDGVRVIVDTMLDGSQPRLREVTDPDVVSHYRKVDDSAWYKSKPD